jgi:hypothetical protein
MFVVVQPYCFPCFAEERVFKLKKVLYLSFCLLALITSNHSLTASAEALPNEDASLNVTTQNIRRMWKTGYLVWGYGPYTIYFNDGYFHGYLQRKSYVAAASLGNWSEYEGWVYPVRSPLPMPTRTDLLDE